MNTFSNSIGEKMCPLLSEKLSLWLIMNGKRKVITVEAVPWLFLFIITFAMQQI